MHREAEMHHPVHRRSWLPTTAIVSLLVLGGVSCATRTELPTSPIASAPQAGSGRLASSLSNSSSTTSSNDYCALFSPFDPKAFSHPTRIDNRWSPLTPELQYVLEGRADRGGGPV